MASVVRLRRKSGKEVVSCDVYIGRRLYMGGWKLQSSKWANPFSVKDCGTNEKACEQYEEYIRKNSDLLNDLHELEGKVLGCWCKPKACHGDILLKLLEERHEKRGHATTRSELATGGDHGGGGDSQKRPRESIQVGREAKASGNARKKSKPQCPPTKDAE